VASLVEELLDVLQQEKSGYDKLCDYALTKRDSIVHNKLAELESITNAEQEVSSDLKNLENRRTGLLKDMSVVLGKDGQDLTVTSVINLLKSQPKEQEDLTKARDALVASANEMQFRNQQNTILLNQAMEMVEFDLTLYKSLKQAPETANYDRHAENTGDLLGGSGFDAKQ